MYKKPFKEKKKKVFDSNRLYSYGLWLLSRRDYSKSELFKKMNQYQESVDIITSILDKLESQSYINDERFTNNIIRTYGKKESSNKIKKRLYDKGISKELIESCMSENIDSDTEIKSALDLLIKKFKVHDPEKYQKYCAFLANKGFKWDTVSKAVSLLKEQN